jgi:hypothetical protein
MIDLPMSLALYLRRREPEERTPRFRRARRIGRAVLTVARDGTEPRRRRGSRRSSAVSDPSHTP